MWSFSTRVGRAASWALLLGVALAIRIAYLQEHRVRPDFEAPLSDALYHHAWARVIAFGDAAPLPGTLPQPWGTRPFFKAPGYPYALAAIYRLAGDDRVRVVACQIALGLLSVVLLVLLGRACGGAAAGWWAGALGAGSWILVFYEQELMEPVLLIPLLLGFLLLAHAAAARPGWWRVAAAGVLLGAAILVRPNFQLFVPFAAGWIVWRFRAAGRAALPPAMVFLAATILAIVPSLVRNIRAGGEPVWISANGGINLYLGNNPDANGIDAASPDIVSWSPFDYPALVARLEAEQGRPLTYREASRRFTTRALDFWREQPGAALALTMRKALLFWSAGEIANESDPGGLRAESRILRSLPLPFAAAAGFGVTGLLLWWAAGGHTPAERGLVALTLLLALACFASVVPFFAASRFRLPLLPLLYVWAGLGLSALPGYARREGMSALMPWFGLLVMVGGLVAANRAPERGSAQVARAISLMRLGRAADALGVLDRLADQRPGDFYVRGQRGTALLMAGRPGDALREFDEALEREPSFVSSLIGRGQSLAQLGRLAEARDAFTRAVERDAGRGDAWLMLAVTEQSLGDFDAADRHFRQALHVDPRHADALAAWGYLHLQRGQRDEAAALFTQALEVRPDHPEARAGLQQAGEAATPGTP